MKHAMIVIALAGCVEHKGGITGTQSIAVDLVAPADPGDIDHRLSEDQRTVTFTLTAHDAQGNVDTSFDRDVQLYVHFLGTLTPPPIPPYGMALMPPLATIHMTAGVAGAQTVTLPHVVGQTSLWVDDVRDDDPSYATGASATLWYRDPVIADIQTPIDETALNALSDSPFENKQITIASSRYGDLGRLVVTSTFAQGYTVSDVKCADATGAPPCVAAAYDHIEVFSFSAPTDQDGRRLQQGQLIDGFAGAITEFNALTEIGFPGTSTGTIDVNPARLPIPVKLDPATWFGQLSAPNGVINFERNEAAPIEIDNATVCPLDGDFTRFGQWKIAPPGAGADCGSNHNLINVVTAGVINDLDPGTLAGKALPRVVGVLRPVFTIWIIFPRSAADLTLE